VSLFRDFYGLVVAKRHGLGPNGRHPTPSPMLIDPTHIKADSWDPSGNVILSARLRINRSIRGFALPPQCTRGERRKVESVVANALCRLTGELKGRYFPLAKMAAADRDDLVIDKMLFTPPDSQYCQSSRIGRDWPDGRGLYMTDDKSVLVWVNEDDHLRVVALQPNADLKTLITKTQYLMTELSNALKQDKADFLIDQQFGYITSSPSNWGTGLHVSVVLRVPNLATLLAFKPLAKTPRATQQPDDKATALLAALGLYISPAPDGRFGDAAADGALDVGNIAKAGMTEDEILEVVGEGVKQLIAWEAMLDKEGGSAAVQDEVRKVTQRGFKRPEPKAKAEKVEKVEVPPKEQPKKDAEAPTEKEEPKELPIEKKETREPDHGPADVAAAPSATAGGQAVRDILKAHPELAEKYKGVKSRNDFTLEMATKCGIEDASPSSDAAVGCVVGDEESVSLFRDFYGLVVAKRHGLGPNGRHPTPSPMLIDPTHIKADSWDPSGNVILSARLRINRSIGGFALPPAMDAKERAATEQLLGDGLSGLTGEVAGQYHRLAEMSPEFRQQFVDEQQLFSSPTSPYFQTTKMGEGWPDGRGFFLSTSREVLAWVNEDDHLKLMVIKKGGDVKAVVTLMREAVTQLDTYLASKDASFIVDEQFGHITSCPSMWGTGLKLSLLMKLPHLAALSSFPPSAIAHMGVRVRPEPSGEGLFDVTNARAMGASEADIISEVANGVERLIQWEQGMAKGDASKVQQDIQELNG